MNAVFELEAQIQQGELPEPEVIFVALGSGGTAAGLLAGLVTSSLKSRLIAIPVVRIPAPRLLIEGLAKSALRLSKRRILRPFSQCLEMDPRWLGDGYGVSTLAGETAIKIGKKCGLFLESTYTGKTFAASLGWLSGSKDRGNVSTRSDARWASDARDSQSRVTQSALFWSTISTTKPSPSSDRAIRLSPALHSLLRNRTIT
jgi:1-aminocyclopropane-1-carboxylate deaminase/D-cysteine desulfhydrase-like pyridoxal-dependent ACC family enzyme